MVKLGFKAGLLELGLLLYDTTSARGVRTGLAGIRSTVRDVWLNGPQPVGEEGKKPQKSP